MEVTLAQMLEAREDRAFRQFQLNREFHRPIVSFSMNIPGPVKVSSLIAKGFRAGCEQLEAALPILHREKIEAVTGCEALYVVDMTAEEAKAVTTKIEDTHPLGRLFDMDVLDEGLAKLDRENFGGGDRNCIVCGAPGRGCASRRSHSVSELQTAVHKILMSHFVAQAAVQSLLEEVHTTPKPGLVDQNNTGSHRDMDLDTFTTSAYALEDYFRRCVLAGMETAQLAPEEVFPQLRILGIQAEKTMFAATGGVNTHKGAIFTMGILCGAVGRLGKADAKTIGAEVAAMTRKAMETDFAQMQEITAGGRLYRSHGIRGIRGEVAKGLPSVVDVGLPLYRKLLAQDKSPNEAGAITLLRLITCVEDTCLIHRGGLEGAREAVARTAGLLKNDPSLEQIEELDHWFIQRNLSPGGAADLLATVYFLDSILNRGDTL